MAEKRVELKFKPFQHQRAAHALRLVVRFLVLVWHRRAGKTVFSIAELVLAALACTRDRGRYAYIAPYLKQAKGVAWDYLKLFARDIPGTIINEVELAVEFPNGARVRLFGADNPDALRGLYFDGVVMDEVADMRPNVWGEIVRPALADRQGWAIFIGTPKGVNLFSEVFYRALKEEGWKADVRRAVDTGVLPPAELEQMKREMTPAQYAQEVDCDFSASVDNVLLRLEDVMAAQKRILGETSFNFAAKTIGVDVARYGDDRTTICPRQGLCGMKPKVLRSMDTMEVAGQVAMAHDRFKPDALFVDQGSFGAGVIDRLRQLGYSVIDVDFGGKPMDPRFENKRAEMWWDMADWVKAGASSRTWQSSRPSSPLRRTRTRMPAGGCSWRARTRCAGAGCPRRTSRMASPARLRCPSPRSCRASLTRPAPAAPTATTLSAVSTAGAHSHGWTHHREAACPTADGGPGAEGQGREPPPGPGLRDAEGPVHQLRGSREGAAERGTRHYRPRGAGGLPLPGPRHEVPDRPLVHVHEERQVVPRRLT
jgi:hypothetical protein